MIEILRVINELEELLDELLISGASTVPPAFFQEMKQECERHGLSYAVTQLLIMEEDRNKARFLHHEETSRLTEAFCKLQQYIQIIRIEMIHL